VEDIHGIARIKAIFQKYSGSN